VLDLCSCIPLLQLMCWLESVQLWFQLFGSSMRTCQR
jgi:hypothetical protein